MRYAPSDHSDIPIRLFKSDVLEAFTHIHPGVVVAIFVPVALGCLWRALVVAGLSVGATVLMFAAGLVVWSFTEYVMHRFVFHFEPKGSHRAIERVLFLLHGVHHVQPQLKTRLVMPPVVSVPLAALFYGVFWLLVGSALAAPERVDALFAGFITGYVGYDMIHYATHHLPMRWGVLKALKRHHMQHHYQTPDDRYGVSTPAWDAVFGTLPGGMDQSRPDRG